MAIVEKNTVTNLADNEFELPVGYVDKEGTLHKTFKLREMTGEVDEAIADKKVRTNAGKIVTETIYGVLESIGTLKRLDRGVVKALSNIDRDYIMLMNYVYSIGETIEWTESCKFCEDKFNVELDAENIPAKFMTHDELRLIKVELANGVTHPETGEKHKEVTLSLPNGYVQEKIFLTMDKNPAEATSTMLAMCTEDIKGLQNWSFDLFKKLTKKDRRVILNAMDKVEAGVELGTSVECPSCGAEQTAVIPFMKLLGE